MFDLPRLQKKKIPGNRGFGRILGRGLIRGLGLRMPPEYQDNRYTNQGTALVPTSC